MLLEAAPSNPQNRTGDPNLRRAPEEEVPAHVEVHFRLGISLLHLRSASRKTLYEEFHPYGTSRGAGLEGLVLFKGWRQAYELGTMAQ